MPSLADSTAGKNARPTYKNVCTNTAAIECHTPTSTRCLL